MDGLMDLETVHEGCGRHLVPEFFPGELREIEAAWWKGDRTDYDEERCRVRGRRGLFRQTMASEKCPIQNCNPSLNPDRCLSKTTVRQQLESWSLQ